MNSFILIGLSIIFAFSHWQYYKFSKVSLRFMIFAFCGGIFFGSIALFTQSILLTVILHIAFNASAVYYSSKNA